MGGKKQARIDRQLAKEAARQSKQARLLERVASDVEPRASYNPRKSIRQGADPASIMQMQMTFDAHGSADRQGVWSWGQDRNWCSGATCKSEDRCEILSTMLSMSALKWFEIMQQSSGGHQKHHDQELSTITPEAKERWTDHLKRGEDMLFRFRTSGKGRIWGYRSGACFHVVWWDAEHKIYPVEKKNT